MKESTITVRTTAILREQIAREAKRQKTAITTLVCTAVEKYLDDLNEQRIDAQYAAPPRKGRGR